MSSETGKILTTDGIPLEVSLKKAERKNKIKAFLLVAPLLLFLIITYIFPIGEMFTRSVDDKMITNMLPKTFKAMEKWDGKELPPEEVFAGFYSSPISFSFPPAFIKEARFRISAEFNTEDINITRSLLETGALSLEGLISHERNVNFSKAAYRQSFEDPECLKMVIDWRDVA